LESRRLIEEVGRIKSAGKIVAAYINDDTDLLVNTLRQIAEKTTNPLKRFIVETFVENYPSNIMGNILEFSVSKLKYIDEGFDVDDMLSCVFEDAFIMMPFLEGEDREKGSL